MAHMLYYCYIFALNRAVDSAERNGVDILDLTPVLSDLHTCKHEDFRAGFAPCMQPHFIKLSGLDGFNRIKSVVLSPLHPVAIVEFESTIESLEAASIRVKIKIGT